MCYLRTGRPRGRRRGWRVDVGGGRLVADGGAPDGDDTDSTDARDTSRDASEDQSTDASSSGASPAGSSGVEAGDARDADDDRANLDIADAGAAEPAEPQWVDPDLDDLPEFELGVDQPVVQRDQGTVSGGPSQTEFGAGGGGSPDPTAGMPNTARSPDTSRISAEGTEAYLVAVELCARLPDEVRLPEEAAELVPAAVEAELEQDIQQFTASEFGAQTPHVDVLAFEEVDDEIWLRLRIGMPADGFADLDPEAVREYALEELEGVF